MKWFHTMKRATSVTAAACLLAGTAVGCTSAGNTTAPGNNQGAGGSTQEQGTAGIDTSKQANIVMYLYGGPAEDYDFVMGEVNQKLKEKINATLEVKYIPWDAISTKYPLIFASGEPYDMIYTSSGSNPRYFNLVEKNAFKALDELLPVYAPETWSKTPEEMWADTKYKGNIYAIPSRYSEYIPAGLVYRGDLLEKYGMDPLASIEDIEAYYDNVLKNEEGITPWRTKASDAEQLYNMFVDLTGDLIPIRSVNITQLYLTAQSKEDINNVLHPAFTEEFQDFAMRMKEWGDKGYWQTDVLSNTVDTLVEFHGGKTASLFQHAQGFVGWYGGIVENQPTSDPRHFTFGDVTQKVIKTRTMQNATGFSAASKNVERALMMVDLMMNDKELYELFHYGVQGRNYELDENGKRINPPNFDRTKNGYGQSAWSFRTDELEIQVASDYSGREEMNKHYDTFAFKDPFSNFNFDSTKVDAEIAAVNQVNAELGVQILFGKAGNPKTAVENYRNRLKAAGIDKIIDEIKNQLQEYQPVQ